MSRFTDKLKEALQVAPPAIGFFHSAQPASRPRRRPHPPVRA